MMRNPITEEEEEEEDGVWEFYACHLLRCRNAAFIILLHSLRVFLYTLHESG